MKFLLHTLFFFLLTTEICFGQWYQQNSGTTKNLNAVSFIDDDNGFAVGDSGTILYTDDGGATWIQQNSGTTLSLHDICLVNANNIWVVGGTEWGSDSPVILYSSDTGISWSLLLEVLLSDSMWLKAVYFTDINTGWVVGGIWKFGYGEFPLILKTTNGGYDWFFQSVPESSPLNNVDFVNANIGFVAGGSGNIGGWYGSIHKTTDGGETWIEQIHTACYYQSIDFVDELNGIAVGWGSVRPGRKIYYTNDGGVNWYTFYEDMSLMNSVAYFAPDRSWVVGSDGTILFSSNGGIDWSNQGVFSSGLNSVSFINSSTGWAVGENGTILHTTNGGATFVEEEQIDEIPTTYSLSNNFPNPFNPSTKIKYSVPQSSQVQIKIIDVLGNEIATLINEEKPVGTYELNWNAANLPSGVYFYRLQAGDFIQTKKMILLK